MSSLEKQTTDLVGRLSGQLKEQLASVILYGSAAMEDWQESSSDINVLCVVEKLSSSELSRCEPIFQWWKGLGHPAPLLLTADEVRTSTDCFPMEFHDMRDHRRVLYGTDLIADLAIDWSFYRAEVEHELRAKLIRLAAKSGRVVLRAAPASEAAGRFAVYVLCSGAARACFKRLATEVQEGRDHLRARSARSGARCRVAAQILSLRGPVHSAVGVDATMLFEKYLSEMEALVRFVDGLEEVTSQPT